MDGGRITYPQATTRSHSLPLVLVRRYSRPYAKPHRRAQPLQSEAANARKASKTTIPGVLQMRPATMDSVLGLVRFSSARIPVPVSRNQKSSNAFGGTKCFLHPL